MYAACDNRVVEKISGSAPERTQVWTQLYSVNDLFVLTVTVMFEAPDKWHVNHCYIDLAPFKNIKIQLIKNMSNSLTSLPASSKGMC